MYFTVSWTFPTRCTADGLNSSTLVSCLNLRPFPDSSGRWAVCCLLCIGDHTGAAEQRGSLTVTRRRHAFGCWRFLSGPHLFHGREVEAFKLQHKAMDFQDASPVQLFDGGGKHWWSKTLLDYNTA